MAKHLVFAGIVPCLLGMATLVMTSQAALADPVTLICHPNVDNLTEDEPTTIDLNDVSNSVIVKMGSAHYSSGGLAGHSRWWFSDRLRQCMVPMQSRFPIPTVITTGITPLIA